MEDEVQDVAEEAIDKGAEAAKHAVKFIPLFVNVGTGMVALTAAIASGNLAFGKFRAAYDAVKESRA